VTTAPDSLPTDATALRALLLAERARHAEELAAARNEAERLTAIIKELQRHRFGRRSEQLDPDQLALALEDLEQTLAAAEAAAEKDGEAPAKPAAARKRQINRGALPPHLPLAARCRRICRAKRSSSTSRTRPVRAAAASSIASVRTSPSGST
jgi:hypothetical protein